MNNKETVSVIITAKNEEQTIGILLDALLRQTYKCEEIVINDNGSTDNTINIVEEYQKNHSNIKLIRSGKNSIGEGRHAAVEKSTGDILAIMDVGICPEDDWLQKAVAPLLEDHELDVVWGNIIYDTKSRIIPLSNLALALVFLTKYPEKRMGKINTPSSAFRRSVWEKLGGFPIIQYPIEDILLKEQINNGDFKTFFADDAIAYYFKYPSTQYEVFRKWITATCSVFLIRKAALGFYKQLIKFGLFFLCLLLILIDYRLLILPCLYVIAFFADRYRLNKELGKRVFTNPRLLITSVSLFFTLNTARLIGAAKAFMLIVSGKQPEIIHKLKDYRNI